MKLDNMVRCAAVLAFWGIAHVSGYVRKLAYFAKLSTVHNRCEFMNNISRCYKRNIKKLLTIVSNMLVIYLKPADSGDIWI